MSIGPADAAALAGRRDGNRAPLLDLQGRCGNASPFVHWHLHEVIGRALSVVGYRRRRAMGGTAPVYRRRMLKPGLVSARRAPFPSRAPSASRLVFAFQPLRVFRRPRAGQRDFPCAAAWRLACSAGSLVPMQAPPAWAPGPARLDWLQPSAQEAAHSD